MRFRFIYCLLLFIMLSSNGPLTAQENFIEDVMDAKEVEAKSSPVPAAQLPSFAADSSVTNVKTAPAEETCTYCGGKGYCEIAGERIPCPVCTVKGDSRQSDGDGNTAKENKAFPKTSSEERLPWDPAHAPSDPLPINRGAENQSSENVENNQQQVPESFESHDVSRPVSSANTLAVISSRLIPATSITLSTIWGNLPFAMQGAYHSTLYRGPGFSISIPNNWRTEKKPHEILGGTQHRYTAPDELSYIVVVTFPMEDDQDLAKYLEEKHVKLLSSFKNVSAQNVILGKRKGLACYYQGILLMRDVACNLFFTNYKNKGYMIYGLYFDRQGGLEVAQIVNSLRIY